MHILVKAAFLRIGMRIHSLEIMRISREADVVVQEAKRQKKNSREALIEFVGNELSEYKDCYPITRWRSANA